MNKEQCLDSIAATRRGFEQSFLEGKSYNRQTQDKEHLQMLLGLVAVQSGDVILDLGTGSGYLAFPMAKEHPEASIIGLDIVSEALKANEERVKEEQVHNLSFQSYDGIHFPMESDSVDSIYTRYAMHHFPDIDGMFAEMKRV